MPRSVHELNELAESLSAQFANYEPDEADRDKPESPTMAVKLAAFRRAYAERELADAVHVAREGGVSWRELGEALGTTGEAARQKYGAESR